MGVDCVVHLPAETRYADVADVLGIALGLPYCRVELGTRDGSSGWYVDVGGISNTSPCSTKVPSMVVPTFKHPTGGTLITGETAHSCFYHFEAEDLHGQRLLTARARPVWLAAFRRVVDVFGGSLWDDDFDRRRPPDYQRDKPRDWNDPGDGEPWQQLQADIFAVQPLTRAEIDAMRERAAYPD
jgi:hypothetical protein